MTDPLKLAYRAKSYFDTSGMLKHAARMQRRGLAKVGAFIRRSARTRPVGVVTSKKSAAPGQPYRSHDRRSRDIRFEVGADYVHIGPVRYNVPNAGIRLGPTLVTERLEFGAEATLIERRTRGGRWLSVGRRGPRGWRQTRRRRVRLKSHPVMGPALAANIDHIPRGFVGSFGP